MIDEKKLSKDICNYLFERVKNTSISKLSRKMYEQIAKMRNDIIDIINAQPQADKWIPISERLPERNQEVLCWVRSTTISGTETYILGSCDNGFWFLKTYEIDRASFPVKDYKILAWRPLPEPYMEGDTPCT